jgi:hypothetical protein
MGYPVPLFFINPALLLSATGWDVLRYNGPRVVLVWSCSTSISTPQSFGRSSGRLRNHGDRGWEIEVRLRQGWEKGKAIFRLGADSGPMIADVFFYSGRLR